MMTARMNQRTEKIIIVIFSFLIVTLFYLKIVAFIPGTNGNVGNDYCIFLPALLDGDYWFHNNGLFAVPWFTPSFGGGLPKFPNPQGMYYSVPQFLSFFINPLTSIKITILLFGILGFIGFYLLLTRIFKTDRFVALLGATLFLFNGFYFGRLATGGLTYHTFMLFPYLALIIFRNTKKSRRIAIIRDILLGSIIVGYMIFGGAFHVMPQITLCLLLFYLVIIIQNSINGSFQYIVKFFLIFFLGVLISASQLSASVSYISLFPRDFIPPPGVKNIFILLFICFKSLFLKPSAVFANEYFTWSQFLHEYEYGVTIIPLLLFGIGLAAYITKPSNISDYLRKHSLKILLMVFLLCVPLALNYYSPRWNAFLKQIPIIKNSSTLVRWFCVYIPFIILITCLAIKNIPWISGYKRTFLSCLIVLVIFVSDQTVDKNYYSNQSYSPNDILNNYEKIKSKDFSPEITCIASEVEHNGFIIGGNDIFVYGCSQLNPYESIFGYELEAFPRKTLTSGPIMQQNSEGYLNIKNPASYVFPKENNLTPGEHFKVSEKENALRFAKYKSFPFKISQRQKIANHITIISLSLTVCYFVFYMFYLLLSYFIKLRKTKITTPSCLTKNKI